MTLIDYHNEFYKNKKVQKN